jgi:NAD(P)-dependent dehydrogenase (short-subunit alcohol dehydrogenase family)
MNRLNNKNALITGGTSGMGLETAREFLNEGARIAITARTQESLEAARKELGNDGVLLIASNAGDAQGQKQVAETIRKEFKSLDILFINAGVAEMVPLEKWDEAAFDRSFDINFKGPFFLIQALLPVFNNPSIVLMTSINSHIGMPNSSVYGATKGALLSLSRTLSGELISRGIRVNAISGGPIATPLYGKLGMGEKELKSLEGQIPARRLGTPSEVAQAVVYFASDDSGFTVGSELVIDGGMSNL